MTGRLGFTFPYGASSLNLHWVRGLQPIKGGRIKRLQWKHLLVLVQVPGVGFPYMEQVRIRMYIFSTNIQWEDVLLSLA